MIIIVLYSIHDYYYNNIKTRFTTESGAVLDIIHFIRNYTFDKCLILYCLYLKFIIILFDLYILVKFHLANIIILSTDTLH